MVTRLYDAVSVEATLGLSPPLQWRGADVTMIVKRPGASGAVLADLREIFLAETIGKAVTAELRARTAPSVSQAVVESQCGAGFNGRGSDVAHLTLRALTRSATANGLCAVAFFTDVRNAFATMCRRHSLELPECETDVARRLRALNLDDASIREVIEEGMPLLELVRAGGWGVQHD